MSRRISTRQIAGWLGPRDRIGVMVCSGLGFAAALAWQGWLGALLYGVLCGGVAAIGIIDLRHHRIPDRLSLPLIALGLIHSALTAPLLPRLVTMAVVWAALSVLQQGFFRLRGKAGLGGGDVKLMTAAAAWLAVETLPFYVLAASLSALIEALARHGYREKPIAFGAHLAPWLAVFVLFS